MHQYTCKECPESFYTHFAPIYDEKPAFCPNCGSDEEVSYVGVKESTHNEQIDAITDIMRKLDDIKKGKLKYGLSDLSDWLEHSLDRVCVMLDELRIDTEV